jgi:hypothetical protein
MVTAIWEKGTYDYDGAREHLRDYFARHCGRERRTYYCRGRLASQWQRAHY